MKFRCSFFLASSCLALGFPLAVQAGTFSQNFDGTANNSPDIAINVVGNVNGANASGGTVISSAKESTSSTLNVGVVKTGIGSVAATALRLAEKTNTNGSATAALILPVIDAGVSIASFDLTMDVLMDKVGAATPADGFCISFGTGLSGTGGSGGHVVLGGLVLNFDTYQNNTADPRSIEVLADGLSVGNFLATSLPGGNFTYDQTFRSVVLHWDANGLDLTFGGLTIFTDLQTPGFVPAAGGNFAMNAFTGGSKQDVYVDNIVINTTPTAAPGNIVTSNVVIEELVADNADGLEDEDTDHSDWLELYNGTATSKTITGWYLSDDAAALTKYPCPAITIPSYGYQLFFASGKNKFGNVRPHTNFTLPKTGGTLYLTAADGVTIISQMTFPAQQEDVSYGALGTSQTIGFLETPTPGLRNGGRQAANSRPSDPVFDKAGGVISAATTLTITLPADAPAGSVIRYTTNTTEPVESSPLYTPGTPINITGGIDVRARIFSSTALPSRIGNRAFIMLGTAATNNVGNNYNSSGAAFSSNIPVIVLDSYLRSVDSLTAVTGARPYRFTQAAVYDVNPATGKASLASAPTLQTRAATHVRGQSSSGAAARPYALEFWKDNDDEDQKHPLLGFPEDSDWVLMTLSYDKSMIRNFLMQQMMFDTNGPGAGVRCRFVEVFFNQGDNVLDYTDYRGVYLLMEKIGRGKDRVNISKLNDSMSAADLIDGGYIIKNDKTPYDAAFTPTAYANVAGSNRVYDIYDPEPPTTAQVNAIKGYVNSVAAALNATDFGTPASANYYAKWLDEKSFIDKTLWYEVCKEVDAYTFSYYFSKDRGGLLKAFPFWDVDRSLGNGNYAGSGPAQGFKWWYAGTNYTYYLRLDQDAEYRSHYWDRWTALRRSTFAKDAIFNRIETVYNLLTNDTVAPLGDITVNNTSAPTLQNPIARHFRKYPILGTVSFSAGMPGETSRTTWRHEIDAVKSWISDRLESFDMAAPLLPADIVNHATGVKQFGGNVPAGFELRFENPNTNSSSVVYTIDGPDPRQAGGAQHPSATTATARTIAASTILAGGSTYKWLLPASAPASTWMTPAFDDSTWTSNVAPLGYGEASGITNIAPTTPAYPSTTTESNPGYFRTTFTASNVQNLSGARLEIQVDDGAIVYLNGSEIARINYPYAPVASSFTQEACSPVDPQTYKSDVEALYYPITIDATKLVNGTNTLAVEVHQAIYAYPPGGYTLSSISDMRLDARIIGLTNSAAGAAYALSTPGSHTVRARVKNGSIWSGLTEATFIVEASAPTAADLVVSELHYHPSPPTAGEITAGFNKDNDFEYIELMNISNHALDLTGVRLADAVDFNFTNATAAAKFLAPGARVVVVENVAAFNSRLPVGATPIIAGTFTGNFSDSSELVTIYSAANNVIRQFTYQDKKPWPQQADGDGPSIVLNLPASNPDHTNPLNWRASFANHGSPGTVDATSFSGIWTNDSDGDGYTDGVTYATGLSTAGGPPLTTATESRLIAPAVTAEDYFIIRCVRRLNVDALVQPEWCEDLSSWTTNGLVFEGASTKATDTPAGTALLTFRSASPVPATVSRKFVRIKVTGGQ